MRADPFHDPRFRALNREASLAAQMVASGVTVLRRAAVGKLGLYAEAFFNLSIGLERLAKLALILDHCISQAGSFPKDSDLRSHGHDIESLINAMKLLRAKYPSNDADAAFPANDIVAAIILCLSEFGKASRYYNLDYLVGGKSVVLGDPVASWQKNVSNKILSAHYPKTKLDADARRAKLIGGRLDAVSAILFNAEDGTSITNAEDMLLHSSRTGIVQKWGQFYALTLVRFAAMLVMDIGHKAAYQSGFDFIPDMSDHLRVFNNDDRMLKSRKTWEPI